MSASFSVMLIVALGASPALASRQTGSEEARQGAALFEANCAGCHGEDGTGDTAIGRQLGLPDLGSQEVQEQTDAELMEAMRAVPAHAAFVQREGQAGLARVIAHVRTFADEADRGPE